MHADNDPPGQPPGTGAGGLGAGGAGAGAAVVVVPGQSSLHTATQASYASPVTTEQASSQALRDPPGQSPDGEGAGGPGGLGGAGGPGAGGVGAGVGGTSGFVVSMSPTFKFKKEYDESGCASLRVSGLPTVGSQGPRLQPGSVGSHPS